MSPLGPRRFWRPLVLLGPLLLALVGCAPAGEGAARAAAQSFQAAVAAHDSTTACTLLSHSARHKLESAAARTCSEAFAQLTLPGGAVRSVQIWGGDSQVRSDRGVLFLADFATGWKVTAAGCTPRPDQPYDCLVEG